MEEVKVSVICYVVSRFGRGVSRTRLMKLLFLIDREFALHGKTPLFRWKMWKYGPISFEVLDLLDNLVVNNVLQVRYLEGKNVRKIIYRIDSSFIPNIDKDLVEIIDRVIDEWKDRSLEDLLQYVYGLDEVRNKWLGEPIKFARNVDKS